MKTWTAGEVELLKEQYSITSNSKLKDMFPNKSLTAICKKARKLGLKRTKETAFINRSTANKSGRKPITYTTKGYKQLYMPEHPKSDKKGYVMEHIYVFEEYTGIQVPPNCCVHHLNGDKSDNRIANLSMMLTSAHTVYHHMGTKLSKEAKEKISVKAKERLKNKESHPSYKIIDMDAISKEIENGETIKNVCKKYKISRATYYARRKDKS